MKYLKELKVAKAAALAAGNLQLSHQKKIRNVLRKADRSPVTAVDKKCERLIRQMLSKSFPQDGFMGEEFGTRASRNGRTWIIDPLDGTRPYIRGIPTHSVLIALEDCNELVVGVVYIPAMQALYWAHLKGGAFYNGKPMHVSKVASLTEAFGTSYGIVEKGQTSNGKRLLRLMRKLDYCYGFMDVFSYMCCANGQIDVCINLCDKAWDCAAAACIVREAGGKFSDLKGNQTVHNGSIILSNGFIHDRVLEILNKGD